MTNVTTVSVARAKQMLSDNKIDNKEAKTLGLNAKQAAELTKALQGNKMNQQTALEQIMMYGHVEKAAAKQNDTFLGGLLRKAGFSGTADFLEDKDKVCTDGKDDGKLSFKEGAKSYLKGLAGGIPKTIINHPIATALTVAASAGILVATGGAAAPILWGVGATLAAGTTVAGAVKYAKADNDADAKAALEMSGTGTAGLILSGVTKNASMKAGKNAGVDTENGIVNTVKSSAQTSVKNAKANYTYLKTGTITQGANATRNGVEVSSQGNGKPLNTYKINIDVNATVEENLANNPGISYDTAVGKYYVQTSWDAKSYIDVNASKGYMFVNYGPGDNNAVEGVEFAKTYVDHAKFAADGTKQYVDPSTLDAGQTVVATKQTPAAFKVVPEGTKYVGAEGPATVQPKSVLRIDGQGRPYQSTVKFMFENFKTLTESQIAQLKAVDPETAAQYGY